jgi:hypothetical protein
MKNLTKEEFKKLKIENKEQIERLEENIVGMYIAVNIVAQCRLIYCISEEKNKNYIEYIRIKLLNTNLDFFINFDGKNWSLYCENMRELKNISYNTIKQIKNNLIEPKKIGKLNKKKLQEHINYLSEVYKSCLIVNEINKDNINKFLSKMKKNNNVIWFTDNKSGYILKNGIEYTFKTEETFISEKIELRIYSNTLETFLKLSNNIYNPKND